MNDAIRVEEEVKSRVNNASPLRAHMFPYRGDECPSVQIELATVFPSSLVVK